MNRKNKNLDLLLDEYISANGKHFNESLAKRVVEAMWHEDASKKKVEGEAINATDAVRLLEGLDAEKQRKMQWDAYVAANATMHDIANTGLSKSDILNVAKHMWFHDDDSEEGCHKIFWYFFK